MNYERCKGFIYEIQEGDTLYLLSRRFSIPLVELMRANPYADVYQLKIGDTLCIPDFPRPPVGRPPMERPPMERPPVERPPMGKPPCSSCKPMKPWSPENMDGVRPWGTEEDGDESSENDTVNMNESDMDSSCNGSNVIKYVVQENDTLGNILSDFEMELYELFELNNVKQIYLKPGSVILLKDK